jgi:replicative DNA helicase
MDYEAQKSVIGSLLMDFSQMDKVYNTLSPEKFSDEYLGRIYHEMRQAYDNGSQIDINIITFKLGDIVGINSLLTQCIECVVTSTKIEEYAEIINKSYKARQLGEIMNFQPNPENIMDQLQELEIKVQALQSETTDSAESISDMTEKYEQTHFVEDRSQGIDTGFSSVDKVLGGADGGDITIIGARPGVGKTAFALNVAENIAKQNKRVTLFSLEMTKEQLYERMLATESGLEMNRIRRALRFNANEEEKFRKGNEKLKSLDDRLMITDDVFKVSEMGFILKRNKSDIAVIDYLQLITPEGVYKGNRYAEVGEISHSLKRMAKKLKIPVIVLCQLNRVTDEHKEPTSSELRESGDIEQDASQIILLWNKTEDKTQKGIKVAKNRNGEVGNVTMEFDGKHMRFIDKGDWHEEDETPFA